MPKTYEFSVPGVRCAACAAPIENAVLECKELKVDQAQVNILEKTVTISVDENCVLTDKKIKELLSETIEDIGYECIELDLADSAQGEESSELGQPSSTVRSALRKKTGPQKTIVAHLIKGLIGLSAGSLILGLCISGLALPALALYCLSAFSIALTLYLGKDTYQEAGIALVKRKNLNMDSLFSVSTLMAVGVSIASLFVPWLPLMYDAALLIFGFRHLGKALEESAQAKIKKNLTFCSRTPLETELKNASGELKNYPVKDLKPGDHIVIRKGQIIPVDGLCLNEHTFIYNTLITGRTMPQPVKKQELIRAGSIVPEHIEELMISVTASKENSYLALLDGWLKEAQNKKAPLETAAKKILQYFVPAVLALAISSALLLGVLFSPLTALQVAATILVSACPCTLGLIVPLAIKIGIIKAAAEGLRFKSGEALQAAQQVDTVVFDLNGTLTTGALCVSSEKTGIAPTNLSDELLDYLAAIESRSAHPFAKAIRHYIYGVHKRPLNSGLKITHLDYSHHSGLIATILEETFIVGNRNMMLAQGFSETQISEAEIPGQEAEHIVYLAQGKQIKGCILLSDPLRKDALTVVRELQNKGIKVALCTGADSKTAERYAEKLGIQHIAANCLAESEEANAPTKTRYLETLAQDGHKVAMVGDSGNDAPAIKTAHFGIAVKSESSDEVTEQKAGAVIDKVNNKLSLRPVLTALNVADQTVRNIKQNLALSLSYNLLIALAIGGLLIGLGFVLNPAIGAALMILQTGLILANAYRFNKQKLVYALEPSLAAADASEWKSTDNQLRRELQLRPQPVPKAQDDFLLASTKQAEQKLKNRNPVPKQNSQPFFSKDDLHIKWPGTSSKDIELPKASL